jgi:hypothetical protein
LHFKKLFHHEEHEGLEEDVGCILCTMGVIKASVSADGA